LKPGVRNFPLQLRLQKQGSELSLSRRRPIRRRCTLPCRPSMPKLPNVSNGYESVTSAIRAAASTTACRFCPRYVTYPRWMQTFCTYSSAVRAKLASAPEIRDFRASRICSYRCENPGDFQTGGSQNAIGLAYGVSTAAATLRLRKKTRMPTMNEMMNSSTNSTL